MQLETTTLDTVLDTYMRSLDPSIFGLNAITSIKLSSFSTGYQNINFLIMLNDLPDKKYVIRFQPDNQHGNDKTADEAQNMRQLIGIPSPQLILVDKPDFVDSSVMIMEYVEGKSKDFNDLSPKQIKIPAETVANMHSLTNRKDCETMGGVVCLDGNYADYLQAMTEYSVQKYLGPLNLETYQESDRLVQQARVKINDKIMHAAQLFKSNDSYYIQTSIQAMPYEMAIA
jgi:hypothetical protein